jgi:hypothetical protein
MCMPRLRILPRPYGNGGDFRKPASESPRGRSPWLKGNILRLDSGNVQMYLILSNYTFPVWDECNRAKMDFS